MADTNAHRGKLRLRNRTQAHNFRDSITRLHGEGKTDREIADIVGLTVTAVTQERESLGLANAKSDGVTFTRMEDHQILVLRNKHGFRWTEIAQKMAYGKTPTQIKRRYDYLDNLHTRRGRNGEKSLRDCKNPECREPFMSEGYHNRFCDRCRESEMRDVDSYVVVHTRSGAVEF